MRYPVTDKNELVTFLYQELKNIEEQLEEKKSMIKNLSKENEVKNDKIASISQELLLCKARAVEALKANNQKLSMYQEEISDKNKTTVLQNHEIAEKDLEITEIKGVHSLTQIEEKMSPINDSNFSEISNKNYKEQEESSDENKTLKDHEIAEKDLGAKYLGFFSSCSLEMREKCIGLLSFYIF